MVLPEQPSLLESMQFQLVGFTVVMVALAGLWFCLRILGLLFPKPMKRMAVPGKVEIPGELIAVITAAIHVVEKRPYRIHVIEEADQQRIVAWSREGRRQIFSSHKVR